MLPRAGVDLVRVSKLLGHADVSITARVYLHELASLGDDSADRIEALLRGISNKSATSAGSAYEKAAETAANSLTSLVERKGIEPSTSALRTRRSPS
jgi:hypothetical protein